VQLCRKPIGKLGLSFKILKTQNLSCENSFEIGHGAIMMETTLKPLEPLS